MQNKNETSEFPRQADSEFSHNETSEFPLKTSEFPRQADSEFSQNETSDFLLKTTEFPRQADSKFSPKADSEGLPELQEMVREHVALLPEDARATLLDASSVAALPLSSKTILNDLATSVILKNRTMYVLPYFS